MNILAAEKISPTTSPVAFAAGDFSELLEQFTIFCVFCTEEQLSICYFRQFYILTKISIEISLFFVYNELVVVHCALL